MGFYDIIERENLKLHCFICVNAAKASSTDLLQWCQVELRVSEHFKLNWNTALIWADNIAGQTFSSFQWAYFVVCKIGFSLLLFQSDVQFVKVLCSIPFFAKRISPLWFLLFQTAGLIQPKKLTSNFANASRWFIKDEEQARRPTKTIIPLPAYIYLNR